MKYFWVYIFGIVVIAIIKLTIDSIRMRKEFRNSKGIVQLPIGNYLVGHPNIDSPIPNTTCFVNDEDLIFVDSNSARLGRIARSSINSVLVEDKIKIESRITAAKLLTDDAALKKTKKIQEFCLLIDWDDEQDSKQNTIFCFAGNNSEAAANIAANQLRAYIINKKISENEKDAQTAPK